MQISAANESADGRAKNHLLLFFHIWLLHISSVVKFYLLLVRATLSFCTCLLGSKPHCTQRGLLLGKFDRMTFK